jgi:hypothetical protein
MLKAAGSMQCCARHREVVLVAAYDRQPMYLESGLRSASLRGSATCSYSSSVTWDASGVIQRREP